MVVRQKMMYSWASTWGVIHEKEADPQVVGEAIEGLYERNEGEVTPGQVVEEARPAKSPMHPLFDWNNRVAGDHWRKHQARSVLRSIRVEVEDSRGMPVAVLANVHIRSREAYIPVAVIVEDADMRMEAMKEAVSFLKGFESRFAFLQNEQPFADVFQAIRNLSQD